MNLTLGEGAKFTYSEFLELDFDELLEAQEIVSDYRYQLSKT